MANREIKTKVAIDGEKEYKESLKNINSALGTLKSELKLVESQYAGTGEQLRGFERERRRTLPYVRPTERKGQGGGGTARESKKSSTGLREKVSSAQSEISRCEAALAALGDETRRHDEEQAKLTAELEKAKGELSAAEKGYESTTRSVNSYQTQVNNAEAELNKLGSELDKNASYMDEAANPPTGAPSLSTNTGKRSKRPERTPRRPGRSSTR